MTPSSLRLEFISKPGGRGSRRATDVADPGSAGASPSQITVFARRPDRSRPRTSHRGAVLVCVMVCLLCVSALVAHMTQSIIRVQQRLKLEQASRQVQLLLDAGRTRAAHQLTTDETYAGETWHPRPDAFGRGTDSAAVTITVEPAPDGQAHLVQVIAEYPSTSPRSVRRSQRFIISAVP